MLQCPGTLRRLKRSEVTSSSYGQSAIRFPAVARQACDRGHHVTGRPGGLHGGANRGAGRKANGLSGDSIVQTLAAICEPHPVAKSTEATAKARAQLSA